MTVLHEFRRNARETVRVCLNEYKGSRFVDVRCWYKDGDTIKPGRNGITVPLEQLEATAEALSRAKRVIASAPPLGPE